MLLQSLREGVAANGRKLVEWGLTTGSFGNLSAFDPQSGLVAISPSGMDYNEITAEDVVVVDLQGNRVEGERNPSSELALHLIFYQNRPGVNHIIDNTLKDFDSPVIWKSFVLLQGNEFRLWL